MRPILASACLIVAFASPADAADRIGLRPGMTPEAADAAMAGRCPTSYVRPPYLTCINGGFIVTATFTRKGRLNGRRLIEPSKEDPMTYAGELAAELGFTGPAKPCEVYEVKTFCFSDAEGTVLGAGSTEYEGYEGYEGTLTSY